MGKVYKFVYPFSDQNSAKTLPDLVAHTYMAYLRECPPSSFTTRGEVQEGKFPSSLLFQAISPSPLLCTSPSTTVWDCVFQFHNHACNIDDYLPGTRPSISQPRPSLPSPKPKRSRTSFTPMQLERLEEEFSMDMYVVGLKRMKLANELNLTERQVKVWFQNRRMKYKRERAKTRSDGGK